MSKDEASPPNTAILSTLTFTQLLNRIWKQASHQWGLLIASVTLTLLFVYAAWKLILWGSTPSKVSTPTLCASLALLITLFLLELCLTSTTRQYILNPETQKSHSILSTFQWRGLTMRTLHGYACMTLMTFLISLAILALLLCGSALHSGTVPSLIAPLLSSEDTVTERINNWEQLPQVIISLWLISFVIARPLEYIPLITALREKPLHNKNTSGIPAPLTQSWRIFTHAEISRMPIWDTAIARSHTIRSDNPILLCATHSDYVRPLPQHDSNI